MEFLEEYFDFSSDSLGEKDKGVVGLLDGGSSLTWVWISVSVPWMEGEGNEGAGAWDGLDLLLLQPQERLFLDSDTGTEFPKSSKISATSISSSVQQKLFCFIVFFTFLDFPTSILRREADSNNK